MEIKENRTPGVAAPYFTVHVDKNELRCDGGKLLPYGFTVGTIEVGRGGKPKINVWMPAAWTPRGYKTAAKRLLDRAAAQIFSSSAGIETRNLSSLGPVSAGRSPSQIKDEIRQYLSGVAGGTKI